MMLLNEFILAAGEWQLLSQYLNDVLRKYQHLEDLSSHTLNAEVLRVHRKNNSDNEQDDVSDATSCVFDSFDWLFSAIDLFYLSDRGFDESEVNMTRNIHFIRDYLKFINYLSSIHIKDNRSLLFQLIPRIILFANMLKIFMSNYCEQFFFNDIVSSLLDEWLLIYHSNASLYSLYGNLKNISDQEQRFMNLIESLVASFMHLSYYNQIFSKYLSIFFIHTNDWSDSYRKIIIADLNGHMLQRLVFFTTNNQSLIDLLANYPIEKNDSILKMLLDKSIFYHHAEPSDIIQYTIWHVNQYLFAQDPSHKEIQLTFMQQNLLEDMLLVLRGSTETNIDFLKQLLLFEYTPSSTQCSTAHKISIQHKKAIWKNYLHTDTISDRKEMVLECVRNTPSIKNILDPCM
jgi:hypothetical protein